VKAKDAEIRIETTSRMHQQRRLSRLARKAKDLRGAPRRRRRKQGLLRVIDESGEDYLYPRSLFRMIALPQSIKKAVLAAA
jgi:hypothetical protein